MIMDGSVLGILLIHTTQLTHKCYRSNHHIKNINNLHHTQRYDLSSMEYINNATNITLKLFFGFVCQLGSDINEKFFFEQKRNRIFFLYLIIA